MKVSSRYSASAILLIGTILHLLYFFYLINPSDRTLYNFYTFIGGYLSVAGIILTFIQIKSVREEAETIRNSVNRYNNILTLVEVSSLITFVTEARSNIIARDFRTAHNKLSFLKPTISTLTNRIIRQKIDIESLPGNPELKDLIFDFRLDLQNIDVSILNNDNFESIDFAIVLKHTDELLNYFSNLAETLKSLNNES